MYKYILFDLDGTLTKSGEGIINSVYYALNKFDIKVEDRENLSKFIGPPLQESFEKYYNLSKEQTTVAIGYYREYFKEKGIYENTLYEDIKELLFRLNKLNKTIILATSKPEEFAIKILNYFDIKKYFTHIVGATMDGSLSEKEDIIKKAIQLANIQDKSTAIMVGDRKHDIIGAKKSNIKSIGVLYGYGSKKELQDSKADFIVENSLDIINIVE